MLAIHHRPVAPRAGTDSFATAKRFEWETIAVADEQDDEAIALRLRSPDNLQRWFTKEPKEVSLAVAARAALRVLPIAAATISSAKAPQQFGLLTAALFRAGSVARFAAINPEILIDGTAAFSQAYAASRLATDPRVADACSAAAYAARAVATYAKAAEAARVADDSRGGATNARAFATRAAAHGSTREAMEAEDEASAAEAIAAAQADDAVAKVTAAASYSRAAAVAAGDAAADAWRNVQNDMLLILTGADSGTTLERARQVARELPLWPEGPPRWVAEQWPKLRLNLPQVHDWDVWLDWYECRLQGQPQPEQVELIYASVPGDFWAKGPAAANRWIKEQLEKLPPSQVSSNVSGPATSDAIFSASHGVFELTLNATQKLTPTWRAVDAAASKDYGGFPVEELYADALQAFADFADYALDDSTHNYLPFSLRQAAKKLRDCLPPTLSDASPIVAERALAMALRAVEAVARDGELPPHDLLFRHHQSELRGMYQRLAAIWPALTPYRKAAGLDRFEEPDANIRRDQNALLTTAADEDAVVSPQLQDMLRATIDAVRRAEEAIPPGADEKTRKSKLYDAMKSAAAQLAPIQRWTTNAAAMVNRNSENAAKTIENLEKLGKKLSAFSDYWEWIGRWWL